MGSNLNNSKYIIALILITFMFPLVSAATPDFVSQQWQPYNLVAGCDASGLVCNAGSVQCNISLRNLDNTYIVFQNNMTISANGDANYTFNNSAMRFNGLHPGFISCSDGVANKTERFRLLITPSGEDNNNMSFLILFLGIGSFIILGFAIAENNPIIGFISGIFFLLTGILIFSNGLFNYQNLYTQGTASVYLIFFVWAGLSAGLEWMEEAKYKFT